MGQNAIAQYHENVYGVKCTDDKSKYLDLFLWAYTNPCLEDTEDCEGGALCNLRNIIGKLTRHCMDCKPKKYQEAIVVPNPDYTEWYACPTYLECLAIELEEQGWVEPIIDLCESLEINLTLIEVCHLLSIEINLQETMLTMDRITSVLKNIKHK